MQTCGTNEKMNLSKGKWQVVDINSINGLGLQHVERDPTWSWVQINCQFKIKQIFR